MAQDPSSWVGQTLAGGRYRVTGRLGEGGMALVFRAHDRNLDTDVVLKVPRPEMLIEPDFAGRFASEIRSMVKLAHPHVVKINDVGEHRGLPFAVMQFCAGGSLEHRFKTRADGQKLPMPVASLGEWLAPVAEALDFIHRQHYVHRDIKPGNILFDGHGNAYVSDFGIAKVIAGASSKNARPGMTRAGMVLGTGAYMPPEMLLGETYDGRADQYALAVTVYEVLSGRVPFSGGSAQQILKQQITEELTPLHKLAPTLPRALTSVLGKALGKEPHERFVDCTTFAHAIQSAVVGAPQPVGVATARPADVRPPPARITPRDPTPLAPARPAAPRETQVGCPVCGKVLRVPAGVAAKQMRCPSCLAAIAIPHAAPDLPDVAAPGIAETRPTTRPGANTSANPLSHEVPATNTRMKRVGAAPAPPSAAAARRRLVVVGLLAAGVIVACLLVVALWQLFRTPHNTDVDQPRKGQFAQLDGKKDKTDAEDRKPPDDKQPPEEKKPPEDKNPPDDKDKKLPDDKDRKLPGDQDKKEDKKLPEDKIASGQEEIPFGPADLKPVVLGTYWRNLKTPDILVQKEAGDKGNWVRKWNNVDVASARPLVALPGSRAEIELKKGLHLTLWGSMPEIWPNPYVFESRVRLYYHPSLDVDMTLERGRVLLRNTRTDGKPAKMRVRVENPLQKKQEAFTIALVDNGAEVMLDRVAKFGLDEPFYEDARHGNRIGPAVELHCFVLEGTAYIRWAGNLDYVDAREQPQYLGWNSMQGATTQVPQAFARPDWLLAAPKKGDPKLRRDYVQAALLLARNLQGKDLFVALQEALEAKDAPATQKVALLCYSAIDEPNVALDMLDEERTLPALRRTSVYTLRHWMAQGLDSEYKIYDTFKERYKAVVARKLMELLHGISQKDAANPATWQRLIDDLNNTILPLRELSAWNLEILVPAGQKISARYWATLDEPGRIDVQRAWRLLIPPGQLPPAPAAPEKK